MQGELNQFYIVADKNCMQYARILEALVSETEKISCMVFHKIHTFEQNPLSSANLVVFIGKNKLSSPIISFTKEKYNEHGIHYGWRGTRAVIWRENIYNDAEKKKRFLQEYNEELTKIRNRSKSNQHNKALAKLTSTDTIKSNALANKTYSTTADNKNNVAVLLGNLGLLIDGVINIIKANELREAQYAFGVLKFYTYGLESFMRGDSD